MAASTDATEARQLNLGIIGVGNRGASNIAGVNSENIVALCDVDRRFLDAMSARYPSAKTHVDFRKLLEQPDLDAVVISTPDHTHFHPAIMAMERGLHVYLEKPLAHTVAEVYRLAQTARERKVATQMGNQHHASDGYRRVAEIVQAGAIGDVREVHAWTNRPIWPQGIDRPTEMPTPPAHLDWERWLGPAPRRPYHETYHPRGWRGWFDFGCGALGDMGPHLLDPVFWSLKLTSPTVIRAETPPLNEESFPKWSIVHFNFPARDTLPPVKLTWYDGDKQPPQDVTGVKRPPANGILLVGERAKLFAPDYGGRPVIISREKGEKIELPEPSAPSSPGHYREWIDACKRGTPTSCNFDYGARLTESCLLGNIAIRRGKTLRWDADKRHFIKDVDATALLTKRYRRS